MPIVKKVIRCTRTAAWWGAIGLVLLFGGKRLADQIIIRSLRAPLPAIPVTVEPARTTDHGPFVEERFTFATATDEPVPVIASIPAGDDHQRWPAIIFLYGIGMQMDFSDELAEAMTEAGFAFFVMEQYGRGDRRLEQGSIPAEIAGLRRRLVLTIQETRRLVDVLSQRPDIDPDRIYLWGASFGAMTGSAAMAYDKRIRAGVMTAGAGDLYRMATHSPRLTREGNRVVMRGLGLFLAELLRPFDPVRHVGAIAPRPLLFQNALQDEYFPPETIRAFHDAAGEPKTVNWHDSPHSRPGREVVAAIARDGLEWLTAQDPR